MKILTAISPAVTDERLVLQPREIKRILVVRGLFRMGDLILATPAILMFRSHFPGATIDFVGSSISKALFENLPIDRHYEIDSSLLRSTWSYLILLRKIRQAKYDLAFDASGSSAAMGSFIVGFSAARLRIGIKGRWDRWFNVRLHRPKVNNKYHNLSALIGALGLENRTTYPRLLLSRREINHGRERLRTLTASAETPIVGIFVGGRKSRGKRWPKENFVEFARQLLDSGVQPVILVGPEEKDLFAYFQRALKNESPTVFEPSIRSFASLIASCRLFVACDSGPAHLACALRVRTIVIFQHHDFNRWGPPPSLGRVVFQPDVKNLLEICRSELTAEAGKNASSDALRRSQPRTAVAST